MFQPLAVETFLDQIWGTTHYQVKRGCDGYFDSLFAAADVENVLEFIRPDPLAVRLVRGQDNKDPGAYRLADGTVDLVRVRNEFADGYSIVLNSLERSVHAIALLAHTIEVELNFWTEANAYITPPQSQGLPPHYDDHDVLVLQIQGSKTWHVYDVDVPPHEMQGRPQLQARLPSPTDLHLEAGDVLYLPRGRVHAAETSAEPSVHLSLGIHPPNVLTLITRALESMSFRDERVLARLPPRHLDDAGIRADLEDLVRDIVKAVEDPSVIAGGLGAMGMALVRRGRCRPSGQLVSNAVEARRIDGHTPVVKYQPLYSRVLATAAGGFALQFAQSQVIGGPDHKAAMLFLSTCTEPFRVRDLPGLGATQQTELARKLIVDGFLVRLPEE